MISCILCPVDGSEHSDKAIELACDLAQRYRTKLYFLHVFMKNMSMDELMQFQSNAHLKDLVEQESERMAELVQVGASAYATPYIPPPDQTIVTRVGEVVVQDTETVGEQCGVERCTTVLADGDPVEQILSHAESLDADMIVMGHRGLGAFRALIGGSVSNKVSHSASCTCVSVK